MKKLFLTLAAAFMCAVTAVAQQAIPADTAVRTGKLPNGLTYYVRSNAKPAKQAEFYILHNVGAIQENDAQQGLAHFLEHMAFNGTKNLPDKKLIEYLETIGVKFGANLNAFTAMEQTCYNMSSVPLNRDGIVDTCLLILHDWSYFISLEDEEIDNERGVIIEELRTRNTADWRINEKLAPTLYNNSKYAKRNIIGTIDGLKSFSYQDIKDFYHHWYRTDQQAIVVVGDFDADQMVEKIKKVMADIPAVENPEPKAVIKIDGNEEPLVAIATDPELTMTRVLMLIKHDPIPFEMNNSVQAYAVDIFRDMITDMFSYRLQDIAQKPNAPFLAAGSGYGALTNTQDVLQAIAVARDGEAGKAFEALYAEIEKVRRFGFTASELERVQAEWKRNAEQAYDNRNDRRNGEFVQKYLRAFRTNTAIPSAETEWELRKMLIPALDLNSVNALAAEMFKQADNVVTVSAPEKEGAAVPAAEDIQGIIKKVREAELEAYKDNTVKEPLIPEGTVLKGSPVVKSETDKFGATVWTLKNGVKAVVMPTDFKADELRISAKALGGNSLIDDEDITTAWLLAMTVEQSGLGKFKATDLQKQLAGKSVNFSVSLDDDMAGGMGVCSPKDLETAMQIIYLYFTSPRWDKEDFDVLMDNVSTSLKNAESNPMFRLQQEVYKTIYNDNKRQRVLTLEDLNKVEFEKMPGLFSKIFGNAANFTFTFVGNTDLETLKPLVEKYLGSLPTSTKKKDLTSWKDAGVRFWTGDVKNDFKVKMSMPKTSIVLSYNGAIDYSLENSIAMSFLSQIMRQRYTTSIREEKGGTYGVSVGGGLQRRPVETYRLLIQFDTNKEMAEELTEAVKDELEKMAAEGPTAEEMSKIKEYMAKQRMDDLRKNSTWINNLVNLHLNGIDATSEYDSIVTGMTAEKVKAVAAKILADSNEALIVMNPEETPAE